MQMAKSRNTSANVSQQYSERNGEKEERLYGNIFGWK
jgi:hypothetical protein